MKEKLEKAQKLYDSKQFNDVLILCNEVVSSLIENGEDATPELRELTKGCCMLIVRSAIQCIDISTYEQENNFADIMLSYSEILAERADNNEELAEMCVSISDCVVERYDSLIDEYVKEINNYDDFLAIYNIFFNLGFTKLMIGITAVFATKFDREKNVPSVENDTSAYKKHLSQAIYERGIEIYNSISWVLPDTLLRSNFEKDWTTIIYACAIIDTSIPKEDDKNFEEEVFLTRAKCLMDVYCAEINARVIDPPKVTFPISMIQDQAVRDKKYRQICELEKRIQKYEPSYQKPMVETQTTTPPKALTSQGGGCYVATAVYGSYDCPQVWTLRRFRDNTLAATWYGRSFIKAYYAISPTLVKWFGDAEWFKKMWQGKLDRMVKNLQENGVESTPYEDKNW